MSERLIREDADGVARLTLNRPDKLNALDLAAFEALDAQLSALEADERIGCVVLRGAGRGFCAGADLSELDGAAAPPPRYKPGVIERLARLPKPVIAAIHGVCFTGGLELALACDFILAEAPATFADTHGKWGLVASWGMSQRLPRRIGVQNAKRMMMTSRIVGASEARSTGLVDAVAPAGELDRLVHEWTADLLANSWFTNAENKRLLMETEGLPLSEGLAHEHDRHPGRAPDWRERISRFRRT